MYLVTSYSDTWLIGAMKIFSKKTAARKYYESVRAAIGYAVCYQVHSDWTLPELIWNHVSDLREVTGSPGVGEDEAG